MYFQISVKQWYCLYWGRNSNRDAVIRLFVSSALFFFFCSNINRWLADLLDMHYVIQDLVTTHVYCQSWYFRTVSDTKCYRNEPKMCIISSWMPSYFESQIIELKQRNNWPQQKSMLETEESLANSPTTVIGLLSVHCLSVKALYKVLKMLFGFQIPSK